MTYMKEIESPSPVIKVDGLTLIGIYGKAGTGKDTIYKYIQENYESVYHGAFANSLKKACACKYGIDLQHFYDDEAKEVVHPYWGVSPRQIAQFEGTELGRMGLTRLLGGEDASKFWIKRLAGIINGDILDYDGEGWELDAEDTIVIPDVRFQNEYDFVVDNGGMIIDLTGSINNRNPIGSDSVPGIPNHASELGNLNCHAKEQTYAVINNGTLPELYAIIDVIMEQSSKHRVAYSKSLVG